MCNMMDLEGIMLSEVRQKEKDKNCMISLMWNIKQKRTHEQNKNSIDTDKRMVVTRRNRVRVGQSE